MQAGLAQAIRARLQGALASELDTVLAGVPGEYAVIPSPTASINPGLASSARGPRRGAVSGCHDLIATVDGGGADTQLPPGRLARTTGLSAYNTAATAAGTVTAVASQLFLQDVVDPQQHHTTSGSGFWLSGAESQPATAVVQPVVQPVVLTAGAWVVNK
jgi:hypothetical protein